jgi:hypothetical protein
MRHGTRVNPSMVFTMVVGKGEAATAIVLNSGIVYELSLLGIARVTRHISIKLCTDIGRIFTTIDQ